MAVYSIAPCFDGGQCLLWWWCTTGGKVHRKGDSYNSQTLPMGMFVRVACVCVCVSGQRGWQVCTPLIREDYHLWEHILFVFVLPSAYHRMARYASWVVCSGGCVGLCGRLCVCVHKNPLILMDQQDRSAGLKCETNGTLGRLERENVRTAAVLMSKSQAHFTYKGSSSYQINKNSLLLRSNPLSTVRFMSKALSGFGGFSAPVMDLFPAVLTLFTLLGVENTDLRDQFTPAGWEPDRTPVTPQQCIFYSRSAFAKTRTRTPNCSFTIVVF